MKLIRGEVRTRESGNLVVTMLRVKRVVSFLPTNTPTEQEIHAVEQVLRGRRKRVVPSEAMKKPDVMGVYNSGMNGVDVNDQYRSYYPPGTTSRKWWKYLFWFFLNESMVNAFILKKLASKKKQYQVDFRRELAKLLIASYNGYKRPSTSSKRVVRTVTSEEKFARTFSGENGRQKKSMRYVCKRGQEAQGGRLHFQHISWL